MVATDQVQANQAQQYDNYERLVVPDDPLNLTALARIVSSVKGFNAFNVVKPVAIPTVLEAYLWRKEFPEVPDYMMPKRLETVESLASSFDDTTMQIGRMDPDDWSWITLESDENPDADWVDIDIKVGESSESITETIRVDAMATVDLTGSLEEEDFEQEMWAISRQILVNAVTQVVSDMNERISFLEKASKWGFAPKPVSHSCPGICGTA